MNALRDTFATPDTNQSGESLTAFVHELNNLSSQGTLSEQKTDNTINHSIVIRALGRFSIFLNDEPMVINNKSHSKPLELLRVLIALGGRDVGEVRLCEHLWPDAEGDVAHSAFSVTLHRLRKILGHEALELVDGRLSLNPISCWVDIWELERSLGKIKNLLHEPFIKLPQVLSLTNHAVNLYQGQFLKHEDEQAWSIQQSQRLEDKMLHALNLVCTYLERLERCDLAVEYYRKGIEISPYAEEFYFRLIKCFCLHDRKAEAKAMYQRCDKLFQTALGVPLSRKMSRLYRDHLEAQVQ